MNTRSRENTRQEIANDGKWSTLAFGIVAVVGIGFIAPFIGIVLTIFLVLHMFNKTHKTKWVFLTSALVFNLTLLIARYVTEEWILWFR
ncbi:hypothetical protein [Natronoglycomyces albus]|uniref:Uncharacterized protein n=1 Tax=Natronoglycomyces albus TaxID=2811108 RepID=A0A895XMY2_9ACTN|nr:hypothetical protein [Natronoglycomyces albus]QSB04893.1 hypothetical protein JQS30_14175 [Natronoglycomyces albus]